MFQNIAWGWRKPGREPDLIHSGDFFSMKIQTDGTINISTPLILNQSFQY